MKKTLLFALTAAAAILCACNPKEDVVDEPTLNSITLSTSIADNTGYAEILNTATTMPLIKVDYVPKEVKDVQLVWVSNRSDILKVNENNGALSLGEAAADLILPEKVTITAIATNLIKGSIDISVSPDHFTIQGEDERYVKDVDFTMGRIERQPQGACHGNAHLMWWNMINQGEGDKKITGSPIGNEFYATIVNPFHEGKFSIKFFFLCAGDFGKFDLYFNDVKINTEPVNTTLAGLATQEFGPFENVSLKEGDNAFKAIAVGGSNVDNAAMLGFDEITILK